MTGPPRDTTLAAWQRLQQRHWVRFSGPFSPVGLTDTRACRSSAPPPIHDCLRGVTALAIIQREAVRDGQSFLDERNSLMIVADAKARIAIYGGKAVVRALSTFLDGGAVLDTPERVRKFTEMCELMRKESNTQRASFEDVRKLLFS